MDEVICEIDKLQQLKIFVQNGIRLDGREFNRSRPLVCKLSAVSSTPNVVGSSRVQCGETVVVCGVVLMVGTPSAKYPNSGDSVCECLLTPGCEPINSDQRSKSNLAYEIESAVLSLVTKGKLIDHEQLSIIKGQFAYRLCINITCLSNAGNLVDTAILAAVCALQDTKLPLPVATGDKIRVNNEVLRPLQLEHFCVPVSAAYFEGRLLLDPSADEELVMQGKITCVFAMPSRFVCSIRQHGACGAWTAQQVEVAVEQCLLRADAIYQQLKSSTLQ